MGRGRCAGKKRPREKDRERDPGAKFRHGDGFRNRQYETQNGDLSETNNGRGLELFMLNFFGTIVRTAGRGQEVVWILFLQLRGGGEGTGARRATGPRG